MALKHHTSKLTSYSDIASLTTFGFRGEALASLCALSTLTVITCLETEVPKGAKLSFDASGKLKERAIVATQRGTTISVESLFHNLPVRRRELERNIKREWHKVIALLNQYACIQTNLKLSVSHQPTKGKRIVLFSTKSNRTTRENIINIFGAKTLSGLIPLDLCVQLRTSSGSAAHKSPVSEADVHVLGHVSRPAHGDGRQTPDRQMFFVNGRPCALPQFSRTFNDVYKAYNSSQSPFIFADVRLDTSLYDVNVSPDKRSILLHDQSAMLDKLRSSLLEMFDSLDQIVPSSELTKSRATFDRDNFSSHIDRPVGNSSKSIIRRDKDFAQEGSGSEFPHHSDDDKADENASIYHPRATPPDSQQIARQNKASLAAWLGQNMRDEDTREPASVLPTAPSDRSNSTRREDSTPRRSPVSMHCVHERDDDGDSTGNGTQDRLTAQPGTPTRTESAASPEFEDGWCVRSAGELVKKRERQEIVLSGPDTDSEEGSEGVQHDREGVNLTAAGDADTSRRSVSEECDEESVEGETSTADVDQEEELFSSAVQSSKQSDIFTLNSKRHGENPHAAEIPAVVVEDVTGSPSLSGLSADFDKPLLQKPKPSGQDRILPRKHLAIQSAHVVRTSEEILHILSNRQSQVACLPSSTKMEPQLEDIGASDAESRLSLIIGKGDFAKMKIIGQFNLGFIIAVRPGSEQGLDNKGNRDELFIIDQHASDEKCNFERLQAKTIVQSQRLVQPKVLRLTALEEEILSENVAAVEANGFKVRVDLTGETAVGSRCQLMALPLSRETTFTLDDLEELLSLLAEAPGSEHVPRPSKVRKMFAMRACRSSIMIGKALTRTQMQSLLRHMGNLEKPWNCPHGRPTMRHLCQLGAWDQNLWAEDSSRKSLVPWKAYCIENHSSGPGAA